MSTNTTYMTVPLSDYLAVKEELEQMKLYNQAKANRVKQLKKQVKYLKTECINKEALRSRLAYLHNMYKNYYANASKYDDITDKEYYETEGKEKLTEELLRALNEDNLFTKVFY